MQPCDLMASSVVKPSQIPSLEKRFSEEKTDDLGEIVSTISVNVKTKTQTKLLIKTLKTLNTPEPASDRIFLTHCFYKERYPKVVSFLRDGQKVASDMGEQLNDLHVGSSLVRYFLKTSTSNNEGPDQTFRLVSRKVATLLLRYLFYTNLLDVQALKAPKKTVSFLKNTCLSLAKSDIIILPIGWDARFTGLSTLISHHAFIVIKALSDQQTAKKKKRFNLCVVDCDFDPRYQKLLGYPRDHAKFPKTFFNSSVTLHPSSRNKNFKSTQLKKYLSLQIRNYTGEYCAEVLHKTRVDINSTERLNIYNLDFSVLSKAKELQFSMKGRKKNSSNEQLICEGHYDCCRSTHYPDTQSSYKKELTEENSKPLKKPRRDYPKYGCVSLGFKGLLKALLTCPKIDAFPEIPPTEKLRYWKQLKQDLPTFFINAVSKNPSQI